MPRPTYTPLPETPAIGDPDFAIKADAFNGALPGFADYLEAWADWYETDFYAELGNGSAASPSMRFASDPDTGLYRAGPNKLGIAASAGLKLDGPLSGLAVTQSAIDATPGRLLKVGDFGLGVAHPFDDTMTDFNTYHRGVTLTTANAKTNAPPGGDTGRFIVETIDSSGLFAQRAWRRGTGEYYTRVAASVDEAVWKKLLSHTDILGVVSQSGGVPDGAIVEGPLSTANGSYMRLAGGLQIAWNPSGITTNPAPFSDTPVSLDGNKARIGRWHA